MKNEIAVSVIIVNFNTGHYLTDCVESVLKSTARVEIFVADNGSTDNSIALLKAACGDEKRLKITENSVNLGFSRANNLMLKQVTGKYLLFLNPDCIMNANTLARMIQVMDENADAGMAGCLIRNEDGSIQATCIRSIPTPWNSLVRVLHLNKLFPHAKMFKGLDLAQQTLPKKIAYVEAISGAFMFVKQEALSQVGPLDENYFLYCEDIDWMMRFQQCNWKILFVPDVEITHIKSVSSKQTPFRVLWYKRKGMLRFYQKFFRSQYSSILMWLVYLAIWLRFSLLTFITVIIYGKNTLRWFGRSTDK